MPAAAVARQLKRNLTDAMWERAGASGCSGAAAAPHPGGAVAEEEDVAMASTPPPPERSALPLLPMFPLPGGGGGARDCGAMDPPLQPPPWKRPNFVLPTGALAAAPRSPHRMLTPRVSWSEIVSQSQESLDEDAAHHSPRTPAFRLRYPASPPTTRAPLRRRPPSDDEGGSVPCTRDQNEGRLQREFCDVEVIGRGQFSSVYRARNCVDRCLYAVKKTTQISRRGPRRVQLREVFALANVSMEAERCPNIVRYFSSWFEDGRLHIQTELCECSLRDLLAKRRGDAASMRFSVQEVVQVLRDVATGLAALHGCNFVHLDIKPDNILVGRSPREGAPASAGCYKIADLGLAVAAMGSGCDDVSEGDCRYLAREVLRGDLSDLPKADIFSLGLVCYELATNPRALPCNGDEWQRLRDGQLDVDQLTYLPRTLIDLLLSLVHVLAQERPAAKAISAHPSVAPEDGLQALHEKMRQQSLEVERNRRLAELYYSELLHFKRQELLGPSAADDAAWATDSPRRGGAQAPAACLGASPCREGAAKGLCERGPRTPAAAAAAAAAAELSAAVCGIAGAGAAARAARGRLDLRLRVTVG